ncbi:MAG: aromatic-ring-hydroxylating dioxygenase subunit beta [Immundisolibacteraceae bacterium]|nr:aromatic-ring-hydroxylating dioxygenase subunit beta [Immundisolibacteraceae bacterium]
MTFSADRHHQIEQFLYHEAFLADESKLDDWLALWDSNDEITYWVPCNKDDVDPLKELSIIYDNYDRLKLRIGRTNSGLAWTQEPKSKLRRTVSNVQSSAMEDGKVLTYSNFHITELREKSREIINWIGRTEHHLITDGDSFKIAFKKIMLINNNLEMSQLSFLI